MRRSVTKVFIRGEWFLPPARGISWALLRGNQPIPLGQQSAALPPTDFIIQNIEPSHEVGRVTSFLTGIERRLELDQQGGIRQTRQPCRAVPLFDQSSFRIRYHRYFARISPGRLWPRKSESAPRAPDRGSCCGCPGRCSLRIAAARA